MIPYEYPLAMINGAMHHSMTLTIPPGSFPKEMKMMSHGTLNRNAPRKEAINLVIDTTSLVLLYSERNNKSNLITMSIFFTYVVPNGLALSCGADNFQYTQSETSSLY
jgi:hypothetical protein